MATGQTKKKHWRNKSIKVRKRVAEELDMLDDKPPGRMLEKDESNEDVFTYVELQRGREGGKRLCCE